MNSKASKVRMTAIAAALTWASARAAISLKRKSVRSAAAQSAQA